MVSIDEITEDINKALGEADLPTPTTERGDTGIPKSVPKSVCSNGRPDRSFVALHVTSGRLSNTPDGGAEQTVEMFHWKTLRCGDMGTAMSAVIGFELSEMALGSSDMSEPFDIDEEIGSGKVSTKENLCSTCGSSHDAEITIQRGGGESRYIHILESNELRQALAGVMMDVMNEENSHA